MEYYALISDIVKYKNEVIHLKKLLGSVKASIQLAMDYYPDTRIHFSDVWKSLEANGVKCCFDSAREYDNYLKGVKND